MMWMNYSGDPVSYGVVQPGGTFGIGTYVTHPWTLHGGDCIFDSVYEDAYFPSMADDGGVIHIIG